MDDNTNQAKPKYNPQDHHWIPQEFRNWALGRGVNIDDYMSTIDGQYHNCLHYGNGWRL